mgnify:CR=1 FL=1
MNLKDPVFQTYVIAASLMCLKMMLQAWITVYRMIKVNGGFLHPEDIKKTPLNPNPSPDQLKPDPYVERSRSLHRNDTENIPIFLVVGFLFTLTQPALWATQGRREELFGPNAREIRSTSREFTFRYRSPAHWIEVFRTYYGPMNKTFGALDAAKQAAFTQDLLALMEALNRSGDATLVLPSEYLEVVITRR